MAESIPAPEAVKQDVAPTVNEGILSAEQSNTSETQVSGNEQQDTATEQETQKQELKTEKELTPAEQARKERNKQRWQQMKQERVEALQRAAMLEAENARLKSLKPDLTQIDDPDEALAWKTALKVREMSSVDQEARVQHEKQIAEQKMFQAWDAMKSEMREKAPDFDQVVNDNTPIHKFAAPFIVESEKGGDLAYWLGKNPDVARDLYMKFETAPAQALVELGRIEARLSSSTPKSVTKAPKPVQTLGGNSNPPSFDQNTGSVEDFAAALKKAGVIR